MLSSDNNQEGFGWRPMLVLSLLMHGVLFSALFWVPGDGSSGLKMNENIYEVTLADMPKSGQSKGKVSGPLHKESVKGNIPAVDKVAKRISQTVRPKNSVVIQKKDAKKIKSRPESTQASSDLLLDKAISKIENKGKFEENDNYLDKTISNLNRKAGSSGSGAPAGSLAINIYKMEVETLIKSNWTYPGVQDIEAIVLVKIRKDGTVLNADIIKSSKNKLFDESALKAIEKSKPLPQLPEGYEKNYEEIAITFNNLKDIEKH